MPMSLRLRVIAVLAAATVASGAALLADRGGVLDRANGDAVDWAFAHRERVVPRDVVVIGVDSRTLDELKWRWPYPRTAHARLVDRLREAGVRQIVYDIEFSRPTPGKPWEDVALFDALGRAGGGVLAATQTDARGRTNVLGGEENLRQIDARAAAAAIDVDRGGVARRVPLANGGLETIAVAVAKRLGVPVPTDAFGRDGAWIDFAGPPGSVATYSFADVLRGDVDPRLLRGRVAVVGATSPVLHDLHSVPTSDNMLMSGAELQANAIQTALAGFPLRAAGDRVDLLLVIVAALLGALLVLLVKPLRAVIASLAIGTAFALSSHLTFDHGLIVPVVTPLLALGLATWWSVTASYVIERGERRRVTLRNLDLERSLHQRTKELNEAHLEVVQRLATAVETRDVDTGAHVARMSSMCERLALAAGMPAAEAELLRHASVLHDIGKLAVPDAILLKEGELDDRERSVMQQHALAGAAMLSDSRSPLLRLGEVIARTHHERWDGGGYPAGLRGEEIPIGGRIAAICDVFDALMAERSYKRGWGIDEAITELMSERGKHFDPSLVDRFVAMREELKALYCTRGALPTASAVGQPAAAAPALAGPER